MARYRVRGPNGAEAVVTVPSPAMDERTFKTRVEAGELVILDEPKKTPAKKAPYKAAKSDES